MLRRNSETTTTARPVNKLALTFCISIVTFLLSLLNRVHKVILKLWGGDVGLVVYYIRLPVF